MRVLDTAFAKGFIRVCDDGFNQNWHERNGGNLSYRIKHEEVESVKEELSYDVRNPLILAPTSFEMLSIFFPTSI